MKLQLWLRVTLISSILHIKTEVKATILPFSHTLPILSATSEENGRRVNRVHWRHFLSPPTLPVCGVTSAYTWLSTFHEYCSIKNATRSSHAIVCLLLNTFVRWKLCRHWPIWVCCPQDDILNKLIKNVWAFLCKCFCALQKLNVTEQSFRILVNGFIRETERKKAFLFLSCHINGPTNTVFHDTSYYQDVETERERWRQEEGLVN